MFKNLIIFSLILINLNCFCLENLTDDALTWLKHELKQKKLEFNTENAIQAAKEKCQNCNEMPVIEGPQLMVFMSFSVPDHIWLSLAKEVEKLGGVFVLIGLPNNSFKEMVSKILKLKQQGLNANIQLNPKLFAQYDIQEVPTFIVTDDQKFDKISGTLSLDYALDLLAKKGECTKEGVHK